MIPHSFCIYVVYDHNSINLLKICICRWYLRSPISHVPSLVSIVIFCCDMIADVLAMQAAWDPFQYNDVVLQV